MTHGETDSGGGCTHALYTVSTGILGDPGGAFIDRQGRALGVLGTLRVAPLAGSNGVSHLSCMIGCMESHGGPDVTLGLGTVAFHGPLLP